MKILFCGDIVGNSGRRVVVENLPRLKQELAVDWVIANGENAAAGFGITEDICRELFKAGVDVITSGNHVWDQKQALAFIAREPRLIRPLNYPPGTPGHGAYLCHKPGVKDLLVLNVMTRLFMDPLDDPFSTLNKTLESYKLGRNNLGAIFVDVHGEATSEKMALAHFLDGRVSAVVGTHTHVPTADHHILSLGTGYQSDAGMCGDYDSVIGMEKAGAVQRFVRKINETRLTPSLGPATLCGVYIETHHSSGLTEKILPLRVGGRLSQISPLSFIN